MEANQFQGGHDRCGGRVTRALVSRIEGGLNSLHQGRSPGGRKADNYNIQRETRCREHDLLAARWFRAVRSLDYVNVNNKSAPRRPAASFHRSSRQWVLSRQPISEIPKIRQAVISSLTRHHESSHLPAWFRENFDISERTLYLRPFFPPSVSIRMSRIRCQAYYDLWRRFQQITFGRRFPDFLFYLRVWCELNCCNLISVDSACRRKLETEFRWK